jgi:hypothetical protein
MDGWKAGHHIIENGYESIADSVTAIIDKEK